MKKLFTLAITMFLGASLALAQTTGDKGKVEKTPKTALNPQPLPPGKVTSAAGKKNHKGGKKGKKSSGSGSGTTPPPK